jgi:hypothetical protein
MIKTINDFKIEKVAQGTGLVRRITPADAQKFFGGRMCSPKQVQTLFKENPEIFHQTIRSVLNMGLCIARIKPLGETIKNGNIHITAKNDDEEREISIPAHKLVKAGKDLGVPNILKDERVFLLITGGYTIRQTGNTYTVVIDEAAISSLDRYIRIFSKVDFGFHSFAMDGLPLGKKDEERRYNHLDVMHWHIDSEIGTLLRGAIPFRVNYMFEFIRLDPIHHVVAGARIAAPYGILVNM